jgi:two-component system cell cycle response regulator DivK
MERPFALIVEDDRDIVALFRHVLDIAGYRTEIALDGLEAMHRLENSRPDVVLLDLQLPGMSGADILKKMREDERMSSIPVVVITAFPYSAEILPVEPDLLLLKPVDINQLSQLVQRLQATQGAMREPTREKVTGLYTLAFFRVRLTFALERIRQTGLQQFGVLFAEIDPFERIRRHFSGENINPFLRRMAERFKGTLRPTDTMAWWEDGCFLTLIETIPSADVPLKIAGRVLDGMSSSLDKNETGIEVRVNLGVLLCDSGYEKVEQIFWDLEFARELLRKAPATSPAVYDRPMLIARRDTSTSRW